MALDKILVKIDKLDELERSFEEHHVKPNPKISS